MKKNTYTRRRRKGSNNSSSSSSSSVSTRSTSRCSTSGITISHSTSRGTMKFVTAVAIFLLSSSSPPTTSTSSSSSSSSSCTSRVVAAAHISTIITGFVPNSNGNGNGNGNDGNRHIQTITSTDRSRNSNSHGDTGTGTGSGSAQHYQSDATATVISPSDSSSPFQNKTFDHLSSSSSSSSSSVAVVSPPAPASAPTILPLANTKFEHLNHNQNHNQNNNHAVKTTIATTHTSHSSSLSNNNSNNNSKSTMISSIKNVLNQRLNEFDSDMVQSSSRKHAVSPIPPTPLPKSFFYTCEEDGVDREYDNEYDEDEDDDDEICTISSVKGTAINGGGINQIWRMRRDNNDNNNGTSTDKSIDNNMKNKKNTKPNNKMISFAIRNLWKRRHARSIEEGIRREEEEEDELKRLEQQQRMLKKRQKVLRRRKRQRQRSWQWPVFGNGNGNGKGKGSVNGKGKGGAKRGVSAGVRGKASSAVSRKEELSYLLQDDNLYNLINEDDSTDDSNRKSGISKKQQNNNNRRFLARTISGLISAVAEEATGLDVNVQAREDTPVWEKHVDKLSIQFERLGIKQLKMGGLDEALQEISHELPAPSMSLLDRKEETSLLSLKSSITSSLSKKKNILDSDKDGTMQLMKSVKQHPGSSGSTPPTNTTTTTVTTLNTPDEIFNHIDVDNSGALDSEELTLALTIASGDPSPTEKSMAALGRLAQRLLRLYDTNGDGVVDRDEYKKLVADMTAVRNAQRAKEIEREEIREQRLVKRQGRLNPIRWGRVARRAAFRMNRSRRNPITDSAQSGKINGLKNNPASRASGNRMGRLPAIDFEGARDISNDPKLINAMTKGEGSIVFEDLKLDLRRLFFGAVPLVKKITPGGPLILEPFTFTITGSFNREDILDSLLIDDGLRRLVARALRRRVRSIRDLLDGAVFYGRAWNMASQKAPIVEVPKLTNIEFDKKDRLIITGKAKVRASPDQPFVENSFKLRTKLGTRENGQYIRLEEPELALLLECPKSFERNFVYFCKFFKLPRPTRPDPVEKFIPLVSPIKKTEQDGFNLGDDNRIKSIYIKDNALRFEISAVLRPGRFLGNHYLAFTIPNRTFIITMDRIKEGIRTARENKRKMQQAETQREEAETKQKSDSYNLAFAQALSKSNDIIPSQQDTDLSYRKELIDDDLEFLDPEVNGDSVEEEVEEVLPDAKLGFFGRFLAGYLDAAREESEKDRNERLTTAISEFFSSGDSSKVITVVDSNGKVKQRGIV